MADHLNRSKVEVDYASIHFSQSLQAPLIGNDMQTSIDDSLLIAAARKMREKIDSISQTNEKKKTKLDKLRLAIKALNFSYYPSEINDNRNVEVNFGSCNLVTNSKYNSNLISTNSILNQPRLQDIRPEQISFCAENTENNAVPCFFAYAEELPQNSSLPEEDNNCCDDQSIKIQEEVLKEESIKRDEVFLREPVVQNRIIETKPIENNQINTYSNDFQLTTNSNACDSDLNLVLDWKQMKILDEIKKNNFLYFKSDNEWEKRHLLNDNKDLEKKLSKGFLSSIQNKVDQDK